MLTSNDKYHELCVGVFYWTEDHGITRLTSNTLRELGCRVVDFYINENLPNDLDIVFVLGPFGSMVPIIKQLIARTSTKHPFLIFQHTEPFPNPALSEWIRYPVALLRSKLERRTFRRVDNARWVKIPHLEWMTSKAFRYRYYGDLYWIKQSGIPYLLSVDSPLAVEFLRARGFNTIYANGFWFPNQPQWGADLGLKRDIPVLWIGKYGSGRRKRLLHRIRSELLDRNVDILCIDGVEKPYIFGEERTELLNRTKVVLNLLRQNWDNNSMRLFLAALNRALIISETMLPHNPAFVEGKHMIEAPINQLTETIVYYLSHDSERQQITDEAYKLVTEKITTQNTLGWILDIAIDRV